MIEVEIWFIPYTTHERYQDSKKWAINTMIGTFIIKKPPIKNNNL